MLLHPQTNHFETLIKMFALWLPSFHHPPISSVWPPSSTHSSFQSHDLLPLPQRIPAALAEIPSRFQTGLHCETWVFTLIMLSGGRHRCWIFIRCLNQDPRGCLKSWNCSITCALCYNARITSSPPRIIKHRCIHTSGAVFGALSLIHPCLAFPMFHIVLCGQLLI